MDMKQETGEFERLFLNTPFKNDRLKELQEKAVQKGLKGDEVWEFIHLDRKDLVEEVDTLKQEKRELIEAIECLVYIDDLPYQGGIAGIRDKQRKVLTKIMDKEIPDKRAFNRGPVITDSEKESLRAIAERSETFKNKD